MSKGAKFNQKLTHFLKVRSELVKKSKKR